MQRVPFGFDNRNDMSLRAVVGQLKTPLREILKRQNVISSRHYAAIAHARSVLEGELETIRAAGTWKGERVITSSQGPRINVEGSRGGERLTFSWKATTLFMLLHDTRYRTGLKLCNQNCFKLEVKLFSQAQSLCVC